MILRWAACISSGSACFIAFNAASRSPLLMASSTIRTEPRIWVRRDLLMMVRRAILRVAFFAELVLAMSYFLRQQPIPIAGFLSPSINGASDADVLGVLEKARPEQKDSRDDA